MQFHIYMKKLSDYLFTYVQNKEKVSSELQMTLIFISDKYSA